MVAVAAALLLPPQQSLMLGQRASSQTVCKFRPRRSFLMRLKLSLAGMGVLSQEGRRVWDLLRPAGPIWTVWSAWFESMVRSSSGGFWRKSEKEGPVLRRSLKVVVGRGWEEVVVGEVGSLIVVARRRFWGTMAERDSKSVEGRRRRAGGRNAAIVVVEEL